MKKAKVIESDFELINLLRQFSVSKLSGDNDGDKIECLLERAYNLRQIETELYWKRASYFWGFLIAVFGGFFLVNKPDSNGVYPVQFIVIIESIGFVFSLSWYLVNRGSKYWQENWEKIIDVLEEYVGSPLYRINLAKNQKIFHLFDSYSFSVSKVNIAVSFYVICIWLVLLLDTLMSKWDNLTVGQQYFECFFLFFTLLFVILMFNYTKTGRNRKDGKFYLEFRNAVYSVHDK